MLKRKKIDTSKIILGSIIFFFSTILLLSIPVLLDYNSLQNKIEKKFNSEFKINLKILDDISLKIFPKPHYLVKQANLRLNSGDDKSSIIKVKNLKIFIPLKNLYFKKNVLINAFEINNTNIYFNIDDITDFRKHLYYKIHKPIYVKKSNFFFIDKNKNTILISPIKNIKYSIKKKAKYKALKIKGNIFDIDYQSYWKRYYSDPKNSFNEIKFKNPNLFVKNFFTINDNLSFNGKSSIDFLNENITFNYLFKDDQIIINSPNISKKQKINFSSKIELNPFNFNSKIIINDKNDNFIIDKILYYILNLNDESIGNLNGNLNLIFTNIDNPIIDSGKINFSIKEKSIKLEKSFFKIKNIGTIKSNIRYYENEGDLIFASENVFEIINKKEFARKFQLSSKKLSNINKIFFDFEKNIENGEISISNIYLNEVDTKNYSEEFYIIKNIQLLKKLIRKIIS